MGHHAETFATVELPITSGAAIGLGLDDRITVGDTKTGTSSSGPVAQFRMGVAAGRWISWLPAIDLGFVHSIGGHVGDEGYGGQRADARFAELRLGATRHFHDASIGTLVASGGVSMWDVATSDGASISGGALRPYAAVSFALATFPRTSFLTEIDAAPRIASSTDVSLDWRVGWGVRYHAFDNLDIDLAVRNPLDTDLSGTTVMVRASTAIHFPH